MAQESDGFRSNTMETTRMLHLLQEVRSSQAALQNEHRELQRKLTEWMERSEVRRPFKSHRDTGGSQGTGGSSSTRKGLVSLLEDSVTDSSLLNDVTNSSSNKKNAFKTHAASGALLRSHMFATGSSKGSISKADDAPLDYEAEDTVTTNTLRKPLRIFASVKSHWVQNQLSRVTHIKTQENKKTLKKFLRSAPFVVGVSFMILLQAIIIGLEADHRAKHSRPHDFFKAMQFVFAVVFGIEVILRLLAHGLNFFRGRDAPWNWFDFLMALIPLFELVEYLLPTAAASAASISEIVKTARLARVLRILRVLRFSPQLRTMLFLIFEAIKSTGSLVCLLLSFLYMFSVVFTMGCTNSYGVPGTDSHRPDKRSASEVRRHFGTVLTSMFTCWKSMAGGVSWGEVAEPLLDMDRGWFYCMVFLVFIVFSVLCFMNIVTGVFVDGAMEKSRTDREMVVERHLNQKKCYIETMRELFRDGDADGTGTISREEFLEYMNDDMVKAYFDAINVDTSDLAGLFRLLDKDGSGEIDFDEFVDNLMHVMRAQTPDQHLQKILNQNRAVARYLANSMEYIQRMVSVIDADMKRLPDLHQRCIDELELSLRCLLPSRTPMTKFIAPNTPRSPTGKLHSQRGNSLGHR